LKFSRAASSPTQAVTGTDNGKQGGVGFSLRAVSNVLGKDTDLGTKDGDVSGLDQGCASTTVGGHHPTQFLSINDNTMTGPWTLRSFGPLAKLNSKVYRAGAN
jgi:hypothetical protein